MTLRPLAVTAALLLAFLGARAAADPAVTPLPVEAVADGVYVHHGAIAEMDAANAGDIANIGFVVGEAAVAMIDSGGSPPVARAALAAIRRVTDRPVRYLINTHMHPDHVFGNQVFAAAGATIIGHRAMPRALASRGETYRRTMTAAMGAELVDPVTITGPDATVAGTRTLDLGGRSLELRAWATAHTNNDLTVLDTATGTLFAGDLLFVGHVPIIDGSLLGWLGQLDALAAVPAERAVPGHGPVSVPWPEALADERRYLTTLAEDLRAAIAAGVPLAEAVTTAAAGEAAAWELFETYNERNATAAFAELEWE